VFLFLYKPATAAQKFVMSNNTFESAYLVGIYLIILIHVLAQEEAADDELLQNVVIPQAQLDFKLERGRVKPGYMYLLSHP
jgi:hypothetical protein